MVTDIIDLVGTDVSITNILFKTLTVARRIGNQTLTNWVKSELEGYPIRTQMPSYRYVRPVNQADITDGYKVETHALPITYLSEAYRTYFINRGFYESIGALEEMAKLGTQTIATTFSPDLLPSMNADIGKNNGKFKLVGLRQFVVATEVAGIITAVKAKLLDLLLEIESEAEGQPINQLTTTTKDNINQIVNNYMTNVINVSGGEGNVFNTGDKNTITVNNTIIKGNLDSLVDSLKQSGVASEDIAEIAEIVQVEKPNGPALGAMAKSWMLKMINKAAEGTWKIGIGTAAALLEDGLKHYFGI